MEAPPYAKRTIGFFKFILAVIVIFFVAILLFKGCDFSSLTTRTGRTVTTAESVLADSALSDKPEKVREMVTLHAQPGNPLSQDDDGKWVGKTTPSGCNFGIVLGGPVYMKVNGVLRRDDDGKPLIIVPGDKIKLPMTGTNRIDILSAVSVVVECEYRAVFK